MELHHRHHISRSVTLEAGCKGQSLATTEYWNFSPDSWILMKENEFVQIYLDLNVNPVESAASKTSSGRVPPRQI